MTCYRPISAHRSEGGQISLSGRGWSDRPLSLPCGKCIGCRAAYARDWALRCVHEAKLHDTCCFITMTYDPKFLPPNGSLVLRDWQLFRKRVRERIGPFRFLCCGEYGERSFRPHYHAVVFGLDFDRPSWKLYRRKPGGDLYTSDLLADLWQKGFCTVGNLTYQSASYVARYVMKKVGRTAENTEFYRRLDGVTGEETYVDREFITMSRRPGLGSGFYDLFRSDMFPMDRCVLDGRKFAVPKYYMKKLEKDDPSLYLTLKAKRRASAALSNVDGKLLDANKRHSFERLPRGMRVAASLGVALEGSENHYSRLGVRELVDGSKSNVSPREEL